MDKKQTSYSRQGSNKTLQASDSRKTDVHSSKPWPRNARRRENTNLTKNDQQQQQQRPAKNNRPFADKRPKQRGNYYNSNNYQQTDSSSVDTASNSASATGLNSHDLAADSEGSNDFEIELNSVYTPGSKKQNLNHLLNFHYNSREESNGLISHGRGGVGSGYQRKSNFIKKSKYNKEQFLQANFQFVINSNAKSMLMTPSPDSLIDWSLIEQINIQTTEEPQCPICLFPPVAAKLTRCGHAYCWPCILHYLALTDKNWRKCPICYDAIHMGDLKSTAIVQQKILLVGNDVNLQLMRRKKGSMFIEKATSSVSETELLPHLLNDNDQSKFSKFLIADCHEILSIIERERCELMFDQDENCPEFVFIQQALGLLNDRKTNLLKELQINSESDLEKLKSLKLEENVVPLEYDDETDSISATNGHYYYFYQSVDGQNIFLHPLNVKMLQTMYDSLENAPPILNGRIVQKENQSMDEYLRKKFTCLGHLPLACQFEIVEIDLKPPFISSEILRVFKDEIMLRQKSRQRRDREEKKREKQINEINDRQMGKLIERSANIDISSEKQFPMCGFEESFSDFPSGLVDFTSPSTSTGGGGQSPSSASFANIFKSPKKEFWPSLSNPSRFQSYSELSCVKAPTAPIKVVAREPLEEENFEEEIALPTYHSIGDVLSEAIQANKSKANGNGCSSSKKGKKHNRKQILFASGMNFK